MTTKGIIDRIHFFKKWILGFAIFCVPKILRVAVLLVGLFVDFGAEQDLSCRLP